MRKLPPVERALRRSRIYRSRLARSAARRSLAAPCVFMHVPKCGGTSLSEALYALVPLHQKIGIIDTPTLRRALAIRNAGVDDPVLYHDEGEHAAAAAELRELLLLMHLAHDCALVHGHFLFSEPAFARFGATYKYVSVLREPIARTVSNYHQAVRGKAFAGDFDAFLDSAMARRMALHVTRFFAGVATVTPGEEATLVAAAKANMARFAVLGFIEDLSGFVARFHDVFGARPSIAHYNRTERDEAVTLTPAQRGRLEALCAPDIELTDYARTLL